MQAHKMQKAFHIALITCLALASQIVCAGDLVLKPIQVAPNIYAVIGDLGPQSPENDGLNNNLGFIVGEDGVLVINAGPTARVARALHQAVGKVTQQPIKWVVNVNSQSHYWLGNDYFKQKGIPILAHTEAARLMRELGAGQLQSAQALLKDKAEGTALALPSDTITAKHELRVGKTKVQLLHFGAAHTAGDLVVWLPEQKVLFTGDIVFTQRILGVIPVGNSGGWVKAFDQAMALKPRVIVPGHGKPTDMKTATKDTRDYLAYLRSGAQTTLTQGGSLQDAVEKVDQSKFKYLLNFDLLARRNMSQVFTEMEQESF